MADKYGLIGRRSYKINDNLSLYIPTLREVRGENEKDEEYYYSLINPFVLTSTNCMVMLYDIGMNFEDVSDWQLFLMLCTSALNGKDLYLIFGKHFIANFEIIQMIETDDGDCNTIAIVDRTNNIFINHAIYEKISNLLCQVHGIEKQHRNFGHNKATLDFYVSREKKKIERRKNKPKDNSNLDGLILGLVCNSDCPYNFETIQDISIYDFNMCVRQILKNQQVRNYYIGVYTGNIDTKKAHVSSDELNIFKAI